MTEQEAATRKLFHDHTTHLGECPRCHGDRLVQTDFGLKHCECIFRPRMASAAPALIRGADVLYDHRLLGVEPWPLHVDRRDTGNFHMWRHMVWRTLAHQRWQAYVRNRPETFVADALFTYDLQDVSFQRHEQYRTMRALASPRLSLLILLEGIDPPFLRETIQGLLRSLVPSRRALGLTTWVFHLEASDALFQTPALPQPAVQPPYALPSGPPVPQGGAEDAPPKHLTRPKNQIY